MFRRASRWLLKIAMFACAVSGLLTVDAGQTPTPTYPSSSVALYAADGPELIHYEVAVDQTTLTKRDSLKVPGAIQYAWPTPSGRHLYVIWSAGQGDTGAHGVTAFDIAPGSGDLTQNGQPVPLKYRPINVTTDRDGTHLLIVYNEPAALTVYNIAPDGAIGAEVKEPANLDLGIYVHQVRLEPSNQTAIIVARGNYEHKTDPGALKVFDYKGGVLTNRTSIAPNAGANFNPRHLDFDKTGQWAFVSLEAQNKLQVYAIAKDGTPGSTPLFSKDTLANPSNVPVEHRQLSGTVHVHPNGKTVYVASRGTGTIEFQGKQVFAGGENTISVFQINPTTGEPTLVQNADTHGMVPRTFALDASGRILVAANQQQRLVRDGGTLKTVPASLAVFRVQADGKLDFVRTYEAGGAQGGNLFWIGILSVPR